MEMMTFTVKFWRPYDTSQCSVYAEWEKELMVEFGASVTSDNSTRVVLMSKNDYNRYLPIKDTWKQKLQKYAETVEISEGEEFT